MSSAGRKRRRPSQPKDSVCPICAKSFSAGGLKQHNPACARDARISAEQRELSIQGQRSSALPIIASMYCITYVSNTGNVSGDAETTGSNIETGNDVDIESEDGSPITDVREDEGRPFLKTIYHPSSRKEPRVQYFDEIPVTQPVPSVEALSPNPVSPFKTRADFEFASYVVTERLRGKGVKKLLQNVIDGTWSLGSSKLSYRTLGQVYDDLDRAAKHFHQACALYIQIAHP